ncbi:MAG: transporter substrate-binding domain-containing protein, partial [Phyllobacteriaceae bacterium]|nr:transporter substrate-binding domain-containing protein [Phyllobacteriaceae bacterium]
MVRLNTGFAAGAGTAKTALAMRLWAGLLMALCLPGMPAQSQTASPELTLFFNPGLRESGNVPPPPETLRFVTVDDFAPLSAFDSDGTLTGIHVDLARALCARLAVAGDCTIQVMPFAEIETALGNGQADAA